MAHLLLDEKHRAAAVGGCADGTYEPVDNDRGQPERQHRGRLSRTIRPEQGEHLPCSEIDGHFLDHGAVVVSGRETAGAKDEFAGGGSYLRGSTYSSHPEIPVRLLATSVNPLWMDWYLASSICQKVRP